MASELFEKLIHTGVLTARWNNWSVSAQKLPVAQRHPATAVHSDHVLVVLPHFHNTTGVIPLPGVPPDLILDADCIANRQWGKPLRVFRPALMVTHVPVPEGLLTSPQSFAPCGVWAILTGGYWYEVSHRTAEHTESRRQSCGWVRCVPVVQHGTLELTNVEPSVVIGIALDHAFDCLNANFSAAVGMWECHGGAAVADTVVG